MVTLKQIALRCGCTAATVSKALNGMPDISEATARRIRDMALEMGYQPNAAARTLKTNRSRTIGLLMFLGQESVWTHEYFAQIAASIHFEMAKGGYDVAPVDCHSAAQNGGYLNYCRYRNYDGIILMSVGFSEDHLIELVNSDIPLVTIDYELDNHGAVMSDNVNGVKELVSYIYNRGHRLIANIHGEDTSVTRKRLASFFIACEELGIDVPEYYVIPALYHDTASSAAATRALLELPVRPTCILYPDDYSLIGGLDELRLHGLKIPDDISVTGYDGIRMATDMRPALTTIKQDSTEIGRQAAHMLIRAIENPRNFIPAHVTIPSQLITGGTISRINTDSYHPNC